MKDNELIIKFTEKDINNSKIRNKLIELIDLRLSFQKKVYLEVNSVELEILRTRFSFVPLSNYKDKKYPNEVAKYKGKRVCLV